MYRKYQRGKSIHASPRLHVHFNYLSHHDWYFATVNNIKGMIILPDLYEEPLYISHERNNNDFAKYLYNLKTWKLIEEQGAVFLPQSGVLSCAYNGTVSYGTRNRVEYWSSTLYHYTASTSSSSYSYEMRIPSGGLDPICAQEEYIPVRLVRDVE